MSSKNSKYNQQIIGINLKKLRKTLNLSRQKFCQKFELSISHVAAVECGKEALDLKIVTKLRHEIGSDIIKLLFKGVARDPIPFVGLNASEKKLISNLRAVSPVDQEFIVFLANAIAINSSG